MAPRAAADPRQSRGYRNRNPGNIDWNPRNKWQGQVGKGDHWLPASQQRFAEFSDHVWGIRALAMLLITYQDRHNLRTIREIINRWAPPNENSTGSYVDFVDRFLPDHGADDPINVHDYADCRLLVEAIIRKELGGNPYDAATLDEGLRRAGVVRPVETMREAAATTSGQSAITVAGAAALATAASPVLTAMSGMPSATAIALILAVTAGALAWVLSKRKGRG